MLGGTSQRGRTSAVGRESETYVPPPRCDAQSVARERPSISCWARQTWRCHRAFVLFCP